VGLRKLHSADENVLTQQLEIYVAIFTHLKLNLFGFALVAGKMPWLQVCAPALTMTG